MDAQFYRRLLGQFATGITVIITQVGDEVHGMTANSFTSLSLDPPLILFCVDKHAHMAELVQQGGAFTVNILREDQELVSRYFAGGARKGMARPDYHFVSWGRIPRLDRCLAAIACDVAQVVEGGDHWIVIGRVTGLHEGGPGRPLLYYMGRYHHLRRADSQPAPEIESGPIPVHIFYDEWHDDMKDS